MGATSRRIILKKTSSKTVFCHGVSAVQCSRNLWRLGSVVSIHVSSTLETSSAHREKCLKVTPQPQQSAKVREPRPFAAQSRFLWSLEATLLKSYAHLMLPIDSFMKSHHQPPFAHLGIPGPPRSWQE